MGILQTRPPRFLGVFPWRCSVDFRRRGSPAHRRKTGERHTTRTMFHVKHAPPPTSFFIVRRRRKLPPPAPFAQSRNPDQSHPQEPPRLYRGCFFCGGAKRRSEKSAHGTGGLGAPSVPPIGGVAEGVTNPLCRRSHRGGAAPTADVSRETCAKLSAWH